LAGQIADDFTIGHLRRVRFRFQHVHSCGDRGAGAACAGDQRFLCSLCFTH
jgi:hypothetical protein